MARVFISYRHVEPDQAIACQIFDYLSDAGHDVFRDDATLRVGDDWKEKLQAELEAAEYVVSLVSLAYLNSEFILQNELGPAAERLKRRTLKGILQVNLAYDGDPPAEVREVVRAIQYSKWRSDDDTHRIVEEIAARLPAAESLIRGARPFNAADAEVFTRLGRTEAVEALLKLEASHPEKQILLHGVSGAGKTSFLKAGVIPRLGERAAGAIELTEANPEELRRACESRERLVSIDQFEQVLVRLAADRERHRAFAAALEELTQDGFRFLFCIRDEYRTAFVTMLPCIGARCAEFPMLPFRPEEAVVVLERLLENGQIEYETDFLRPLCDAVAEGVPNAVLPAILQVIAYQCQSRRVRLTRAAWERLVREGLVFEEHVRGLVLDLLPTSVSRLDATRTLLALTSGDVKSPFRTVAEIAEEKGVTAAVAARTLTVAAAQARVVSRDLFAAGAEARFRLTHDLFVAPIRRLHELALRRKEKRRTVAVASTLTLLALLLSVLLIAAIRASRRVLALSAMSDYSHAFSDLDEGKNDTAALYAAKAFRDAPSTDPHRSTYALAALHTSLSMSLPVVLPRVRYEASLINEDFIVLSGPAGTLLFRADGSLIAQLPPLLGRAIGISSDGRYVAGTFIDHRKDRTPWIEDLQVRTRVPWEEVSEYVDEVRFSDDASLLVTRTGNVIRVWSRETGRPLHDGIEPPHGVAAADVGLFLGSGVARAVYPDGDNAVLTDLRTRETVRLPHGGTVTSAMFSGDGRFVATSAIAGTTLHVTLWDPMSRTVGSQFVLSLKETDFTIHDVNQDGTKILAAGADEKIYLFDTLRHTVRIAPDYHDFDFHYTGGPATFMGGATPVRRLRFLLDDRVVVAISGGTDILPSHGSGTSPLAPAPVVVRTWTADTFQQWGPVVRLPVDILACELSRSASHLHVVLRDGRVVTRDLRPKMKVLGMMHERDFPTDAMFSPDARLVLANIEMQPPRVLDVSAGTYRDVSLIPAVRDLKARLRYGRFLTLWWSEERAVLGPADTYVQAIDLKSHRRLPARPLVVSRDEIVNDVAISQTGGDLRILTRDLTDRGAFGPIRIESFATATGKRTDRILLETMATARFTDDAGSSTVGVSHVGNVAEIHVHEARGNTPSRFEVSFDPKLTDSTVAAALLDGSTVFYESSSAIRVTTRSGASFRIAERQGEMVVTNPATSASVLLPRGRQSSTAIFAGDAQHVALVETGGKQIQVWSLATGRPVTAPMEMATPIVGATFIDSNTALVVMTRDGVVSRLFVGDPAPFAPGFWKDKRTAWIGDLAVVMTGRQLDPGFLQLAEEQYTALRKDALARLTTVAKSDVNARHALAYLEGAR